MGKGRTNRPRTLRTRTSQRLPAPCCGCAGLCSGPPNRSKPPRRQGDIPLTCPKRLELLTERPMVFPGLCLVKVRKGDRISYSQVLWMQVMGRGFSRWTFHSPRQWQQASSKGAACDSAFWSIWLWLKRWNPKHGILANGSKD